jgi:uncharacterized protein YjiS (DUF1127 family)
MTTATDLEMAIINRTDNLRREVDDLAQRIRTVCPEHSRVRTASELRGMAHSLSLLTDHVLSRADALEASHGR